jgi:hypothetical protein
MARNQARKSHEVLRQTGFETTFRGRCRRSQSGAQSKKPRVVRGLRLPQGLLSRFEVFVLAEQTRSELSLKPAQSPLVAELGLNGNKLHLSKFCSRCGKGEIYRLLRPRLVKKLGRYRIFCNSIA